MSAGGARAVLADVFGFHDFRPGQQAVVDHLVDGGHALAVMPTGAGKSLCYQIPAILSDRPTVVVSPLVALMDDQVAGLRAYGVDAARIHSGRPREANVADWRRLQAGETRIVYMSPERLMTDRMLSALDAMDPAYFIVDEAHCISKWGAAFRPEYDQLSALVERFPRAVIGGFTATADRATQADIAAKLFRGDGRVFVQGFDRPNLHLAAEARVDRKRQVLDFVNARRGASGIVYCLSRKSTEEIATVLRGDDVDAIAYHAGQEPLERAQAQDRFMTDPGVVMVATIAFGMGIDKPDIRYVVHLDLPSSVEAYYQEIGRAGRDGAAADTLLLYGPDDLRMRRIMIKEGGGDEEAQRREQIRLDALFSYAQAPGCRRKALLAYFDEDSEDCGNCDNCLDPPELTDGAADLRALCAVIRATGGRFGKSHVIDVLRGADTEKIRERGHDVLPVYATGKARSQKWWMAFLNQALADGRLTMNMEAFGALEITARGAAVEQGREPFLHREIVAKGGAARRPASSARASAADVDDRLLSRLKAKRLELAQARGVPAYVVFPDATLIEMARARPANEDEMLAVNGVGPKKFAAFGPSFIEILSEFT